MIRPKKPGWHKGAKKCIVSVTPDHTGPPGPLRQGDKAGPGELAKRAGQTARRWLRASNDTERGGEGVFVRTDRW